MANSAPKIAATERREATSVVDKKAALLVKQIKQSWHFVAFTGAGISTSAAIPTPSHMALVELQNRSILKYLVSQNCDGLHRRSGILLGRISELHGNSNRESCHDCGKEYIRDFRAVSNYEKGDHDHRTTRKCARCGGALYDSIINFGESLPAQAMELAQQNAEMADLCLVLGSSLTVTPANSIPEMVGERKGAKLAVCNLQTTPIDHLTDLRIFSEADLLMTKVMEKLGFPIPPFVQRRRLMVKVETQEEDRHRLTATGVDTDGNPMTYLQPVRLEGSRRIARAEPFVIQVRESLQPGSRLKLDLEFMGHFDEPNLELVHEYNGDEEALYELEFNLQNGEWTVIRQDELADDTGSLSIDS
ncbi:unnamed protein product [Penicillium olsonii]|uniref:protein acetyllysine N-acetyltransferase n=1 Tax=Penicillium olsonii TaxID=99116 RepID=A0A9W4IEQ1_PENOL|nr:unnamed protein product [Penicillium olsonii]CAG8266679.1 unnamed protein product [Penicillium olsonii]